MQIYIPLSSQITCKQNKNVITSTEFFLSYKYNDNIFFTQLYTKGTNIYT